MGIRSYAQNFEDVMLWRALQNVECGYFIDVGSQHPVKHSVTKAFSENGWRGIHVEPVPEFAEMLREDRPNDKVIQAIVSDDPGVASIYAIAGTGLSTGVRSIAEAHSAAGFRFREIPVATLTLDDLLESAPTNDVHFLKIDAEGMERLVLESWRKSKRKPWIVVIEAIVPGSHEPSHETWEELVLAKGYSCVYFDGLNRFYVSKAHAELNAHFALPPNVFDSFQLGASSDYAIVLQRVHEEELARLNHAIAELERQLTQAGEEVQALDRRWQASTDTLIADVRRAISAELIGDRERERARAKAKLDAVIKRERDALAAAGARHAELAERAAQLQATVERNAIEADHAVVLQRIHEEELARLNRAIADRERRLAEAGEEAKALDRRWQASTETLIADVRRVISAELIGDRERERARAKAQLDEVIERERQALAAAGALNANLAERAAQLQATVERNAAVAAARERSLLTEARSDEEALRRDIQALRADRDQSRAEAEQARLALEEARLNADANRADAARQLADLRSAAEHAHTLMQAAITEPTGRWQRIGQALGLARPSASLRALASWSLADAEQPPTLSTTTPQSERAMNSHTSDETRNPHLRANSLAELLFWDDTDFVRCAYVTVLGRLPDVEGEHHYTNQLREGHSKREVLWKLRTSAEGRNHDPGIAGFDRALRKAARQRSKWLWPFAMSGAIERDTPKDRRHRAHLNEMALLRSAHIERNRILAALIDQPHEFAAKSDVAVASAEDVTLAVPNSDVPESDLAKSDLYEEQTSPEQGSRERYALDLIKAGKKADDQNTF